MEERCARKERMKRVSAGGREGKETQCSENVGKSFNAQYESRSTYP